MVRFHGLECLGLSMRGVVMLVKIFLVLSALWITPAWSAGPPVARSSSVAGVKHTKKEKGKKKSKQERQEEEAEAFRIKQEVETSANIPPPPVEDEDANLAFWSAHENEGRTYYYNSRTHESTYEKPAGFIQPEKSKNDAQHVEL